MTQSDISRDVRLESKMQNLADIKKAAKEEGMSFLRDSALSKVNEGWTTLKEINKVTFVE